MPSVWSRKDERQYEKIKKSSMSRGLSTARAEEIAGSTVNKTRREEGRTPNRRTEGTGNPKRPLEKRRRDELRNIGSEKHVRGRSRMKKADLVTAIRDHD